MEFRYTQFRSCFPRSQRNVKLDVFLRWFGNKNEQNWSQYCYNHSQYVLFMKYELTIPEIGVNSCLPKAPPLCMLYERYKSQFTLTCRSSGGTFGKQFSCNNRGMCVTCRKKKKCRLYSVRCMLTYLQLNKAHVFTPTQSVVKIPVVSS